jgi:hypothetical protein
MRRCYRCVSAPVPRNKLLVCSCVFAYSPTFLCGGRAVRIGLKGRVSPGTRDLIFGGAVLTALAHAGYVRPRSARCLGVLWQAYAADSVCATGCR